MVKGNNKINNARRIRNQVLCVAAARLHLVYQNPKIK